LESNCIDSDDIVMNSEKKSVTIEVQEEALHYFFHKRLSVTEIAQQLGKSPRTIYRYLKKEKKQLLSRQQVIVTKISRRFRFSDAIVKQVLELKQENPKRSARIIRELLEQKEISSVPSENTIRRILIQNGLGRVASESQQGYVMFEREQANELWQVDIAGVQSVGHLGQVYLFAFLDDKSRFIPAAFYTDNQKGMHVIRLIQQATVNFGRPQAILADNGTQFRNILTTLESKYEKILHLLDIKPIYARVRHPQTKGKLERFFGTVKSMFLSEVRFTIKSHPEWTLKEFNQHFQDWLQFYNYKHHHRSLPKKSSPAQIYFHSVPRIYRPLEVAIEWDRWMFEKEKRKVSKSNMISFRGQQYVVPPGYAGLQVELWIYDNSLEILRNNQTLATFPIEASAFSPERIVTHERRVAHAGTIGYGGKYYTVSYKMAGQQVSVKESADGTTLLIYYQNQLIKKIPK